MRTRRIPRGSVTCASTTRESSSLRTTPECGKSVDQRLPAHAQDPVALYEHIEVHRVKAVSGGVREAADVTRRDGVGHPINEGPPIGGRANMPQAAQTGPRQSTKLRIAHAEEPRPREFVVFHHSLTDLRE